MKLGTLIKHLQGAVGHANSDTHDTITLDTEIIFTFGSLSHKLFLNPSAILGATNGDTKEGVLCFELEPDLDNALKRLTDITENLLANCTVGGHA